MDWDLKPPCWDFAEFERQTEPNNNIIPFVGSTSFVGEQKKKKKKKNRGGDCSVDLKLGRFGDFGGEVTMNKWKETRVSTMISSPLTTLKRGRASNNNGNLTMSCLVDGCDADLSKCRDYHRRHKVCEAHSKTPKVSVGGQEQRFCQQCSRFHLLVEFDEAKRSCRKRLDGHNRRRRKPQPEPLSMNSGGLFPYQGSRFLPFSSPPQIFPSTAVASTTWPGIMKTEEDSTVVNTHHLSLHSADRQSSFSVSFSRNQKGGKQFPFLQVNELGDRTLPKGSVCQPLLNTIASSEATGTGGKMFSRALDSDCALSLLSSPPTQHSGISLSHVMQQQQQHPDSIPMSQPLFPGLQYNNGLSRYNSHGLSRYDSQGMDGGMPMASVLVSDDTTDAELSCQGIFHLGPNGSSQNGIPQTLPFSWEEA